MAMADWGCLTHFTGSVVACMYFVEGEGMERVYDLWSGSVSLLGTRI